MNKKTKYSAKRFTFFFEEYFPTNRQIIKYINEMKNAYDKITADDLKKSLKKFKS